ncbi:hypothetical protein SLA2020_198620 [Shorea laevis]
MECTALAFLTPRTFTKSYQLKKRTQLWKKIEERKRRDEWNLVLEECQDEEGNIYTKKTYGDLQRQGLL